MTEIEKLARDICWATFFRKPKEDTKASYWRKITPAARAYYITEARRLVFIVKKLKPLRVLMMVDWRDEERRER